MPTLVLALDPGLLDWLEPARGLLLPAEAGGNLVLERADEPSAALGAATRRIAREGGRWEVVIAATEEVLLAAAPTPPANAAGVTLWAVRADPGAGVTSGGRFGNVLAAGGPRRRVVRTPGLPGPGALAPLEGAYLLLALAERDLVGAGEYVLRDGSVTLDRGALAAMVAAQRATVAEVERSLREGARTVRVRLLDAAPPAEPLPLPRTAAGLAAEAGARLPGGPLSRGARGQASQAWRAYREGAERSLAAHERAIGERQRSGLTEGLARASRQLGREGAGTEVELTRAELDTRRRALAEERGRLAGDPSPARLPGPLDEATAWGEHGRAVLAAAARRPGPGQAVAVPVLALVALLLVIPGGGGRGAWLAVGVLAALVAASAVMAGHRIGSALRRARERVEADVEAQLEQLVRHEQAGRELVARQLALWRAERNDGLLAEAQATLRDDSLRREHHETRLRARLAALEEIASALPQATGEPRDPTLDLTLDPARPEAGNALYHLASYAADEPGTPELLAAGARRALPWPTFAGVDRLELQQLEDTP